MISNGQGHGYEAPTSELKTPTATSVSSAIIHCVHEKMPPKNVKKSSKLASFVHLQFNSMNICLFSVKLPILVKICPIVIEMLTFNKWS